ncbi:transcriptional regulator [Parenemella sanctibonifatiensis]|uniref:Transcriptional regulator n=2 Tax=Parenemella sanctibonifatiensis TaxID=2016505 RepID=A0A255EGX2_9ACTN|nr:transcriptional regulator [Parenemella sanctibonifatiensis]
METLAHQLRERRRDLGLTQAELADLADVSERFVRAVEAGKATVRVDKLGALVDTLGLELSARLKERS